MHPINTSIEADDERPELLGMLPKNNMSKP